MTASVTVSGGPDGIAAHVADLDGAAGDLLLRGASLEQLLADLGRDLVALEASGCSLLDPAGAWRAGAAVAAASTRLQGDAVELGRLAGRLRLAARAYRQADRLPDALFGALHAPGALWAGFTDLLHTGDPAHAAEDAIAHDPHLADTAVDALSLLLGGTAPVTRTLSTLFPDGRPDVRELGGDPDLDAAGSPDTAHDLVDGLARRNAQAAPNGGGGVIDVRIVGAADPAGRRSVVVDIPGTKSWSVAGHNPDVTGLGTNLRALGGAPSTYAQGVLQAMRSAGVGPGDDVTFVGHSQGGLIAVELASRLAADPSGPRVRRVLTAGAPIGLVDTDLPPDVPVLALEQDGDVVPHLDGRANADTTGITTVRLHRDDGVVGDEHDLRRSYLPGAADVDACDDPSVRAFLDDLHGELAGRSVTTRTFLVTRTYP